MIDSPANTNVKALRSLSTSKGRREQGRFLVEGVRAIEEGLLSGRLPAICLYNYELVGRTDRGREVLKKLGTLNVTLLEASERALEAACNTLHPQGIIAAFQLLEPRLPERTEVSALAVVCDSVQDPGNLGTLLRSAEAAGATAVWLSPGCADAYSPKVVRAAMGAHFRLPIFAAAWSAIQSGLGLIGITPTDCYAGQAGADTAYDQVDWTRPAALIVSNEAHGLSAEAKAAARDATLVSIPMNGGTESLNAGVAASIILFEAARQRRAARLLKSTL